MGHSGHGNILNNKFVRLGLGAAAAGTGLGLAGIGPMAGLFGAAEGGGGALGAGLLEGLGGMGAEQAAALAAQNAGLGIGADMATLSAANTAGNGAATLGAKLAGATKIAGKAGAAAGAMGLLSPQPIGSPGSLPANNTQIQNTSLYPANNPGMVGSPVGMNDPKMRELIMSLISQGRGQA